MSKLSAKQSDGTVTAGLVAPGAVRGAATAVSAYERRAPYGGGADARSRTAGHLDQSLWPAGGHHGPRSASDSATSSR
jgi:hypothetical protein